MATRIATALLAFAAVLAAPAWGNPVPGRTMILPGSALGPVAIGDERVPVEAAIGPGRVVRRFRTPRVPLPGEVVRYRRAGLEVTFLTAEASAGAWRIRSASARYRTPRGIGAGSPRAAVLRAYPAARCDATGCAIVHRRAGFRVETRFAISRGRVVRVRLSRMPAAPRGGAAAPRPPGT
ncbi:MAG: hypothetical protein U0237_02745 [Thermoleophilia bacterium]